MARPPTPLVTGLDVRLAHRLALAGRLLRTQADAQLAARGLALGAPAVAVLLRLNEADGLSQAELSRRQRVEAPTMCRMVDRLEREGLVERRPDPDDRRATRVCLTEAGRDAAGVGAEVVDAIEERAFAGLVPAERRTLLELLGRVLEAVPTTGGAGS